MTTEEFNAESNELGKKILQWLRDMPDAKDLHAMIISMAVVSTTENKADVSKEGFDAIASWAEMVCQNLEMIALFQKSLLIARVGEDGAMEVDFSPQALAVVERARQSENEK